jgi:hypothetical protein
MVAPSESSVAEAEDRGNLLTIQFCRPWGFNLSWTMPTMD